MRVQQSWNTRPPTPSEQIAALSDAVTEAADNLVADRLLLPADADSVIAAAQASNVLQ